MFLDKVEKCFEPHVFLIIARRAVFGGDADLGPQRVPHVFQQRAEDAFFVREVNIKCTGGDRRFGCDISDRGIIVAFFTE